MLYCKSFYVLVIFFTLAGLNYTLLEFRMEKVFSKTDLCILIFYTVKVRLEL